MKNLVVGAGLTGAVIAERIATMLGEDVTVIDRASHVGGMHYDYVDKDTNILVHQKHVNFLHTEHKFIWDYLSKFSKMMPVAFKPSVRIQGKNVSMPLCLCTVEALFPEDFGKKLENKLIAKFGYNKQITIAEMYRNMDEDLKFLADYFYENVLKPYTMKQWGVDEDALPDCADTYYPFYVSLDDRYYKEKYVAIPETGWTELIENILKSNKNIKLKLNTDFSDINPAKFDRIFFTGSIDEYFDYKHGELPYRSVRMEIDSKIYQPDCHSAAYNWPYEYDFIRAHIFADYILDKSYSGNKDIIGYEYVEKFELGKNERFYPVNNIVSNEIFAKYAEDASALENVYFAGRLGEFKYYESDELVRRAFETVASLMRKNEIVEEIVEIVEDFSDEDNFEVEE